MSQIAEAIAATSKKTEKVRLVAEYFRTRPIDEAAQAAVFLSGRTFPAWEERTLNVGGALLWRAVGEISGKPDVALTAAYRRYGDMGSASEELLAATAPAKGTLTISEVAEAFDELARTSAAGQKLRVITDLLRRATALEAKYIVKIASGDLRIGLRASLVEEAVAKAYGETLKEVQHANMLLGDIGGTLRLAAQHLLGDARMRLFHPLGFMLASPAQDAEEAFSCFSPAEVEDKYDGIRAQAHCGGAEDPTVRLFSRTLDEISQSFPELPPALRAFPEPVILDGEILAWSESLAQALPFSELQKRLGRKKVSRQLMIDVPVVYIVFDVLYAGGELAIQQPFSQRRTLLENIFGAVPDRGFIVAEELATSGPQGALAFEPAITEVTLRATDGIPRVVLAPATTAISAQHLDELFEQARRRGNEGLMVKDTASAYSPGRRGKAWLKIKRELATLDVVVTAVEWGHGKRAKVLSDYTFAVRDGDELKDVGKAYSGLTDAEIDEMTRWFLQHTTADEGYRRVVEPQIVIEVAFNNMMRSGRHASGYALRFPRIVRLRPDKSPDDIDTLERVREIYDQQAPAQLMKDAEG
ncbi:MAG TPA: ATP-dependent DNA ligase [Candidatus Limnocylindrales bacterium]|nr:ATP-dependent DNA ligase [Candidatus Limnocylindrales bacterium]